MKIFVINGPNLNLLGSRNLEVYGLETLDQLTVWLKNTTLGKEHDLKFFQSNHEGEIIDAIHDSIQWANGILINPGALTHYSYSIRDAIEAISIPCVEIHLSNIYNREIFRKKSVIKSVCIHQVIGKGKISYLEGLNLLINHIIKD